MSNMANLSKEGLVIVAMISGVFMAVLLGMGMMKTVFGGYEDMLKETKKPINYKIVALGEKSEYPVGHSNYWAIDIYQCSKYPDRTFEYNYTDMTAPRNLYLAEKVGCSDVVQIMKEFTAETEAFKEQIEKTMETVNKSKALLNNDTEWIEYLENKSDAN